MILLPVSEREPVSGEFFIRFPGPDHFSFPTGARYAIYTETGIFQVSAYLSFCSIGYQ